MRKIDVSAHGDKLADLNSDWMNLLRDNQEFLRERLQLRGLSGDELEARVQEQMEKRRKLRERS